MVKAAILGFGTVGSGVAEVLSMNAQLISKRLNGEEVQVKYIVDIRDFPDSPFAHLLTKDFAVVEQDKEVSIVCECIGGVGVAYDFTKRALRAGKHVVTSNKELVATHGCELFTLAAENGVSYLFEASVGGGIPIIRPLYRCLAANDVTGIYGILNGTTNYILTSMAKNGESFDSALKEAQFLGYAEADPSADVLGWDVCRKISILASLALGRGVDPNSVSTEGIDKITASDIQAADALGFCIKLVGSASFDGGKATVYVAPHLVEKSQPLAGIEGVRNAVVVTANAVGSVMFCGPGAGMLPTASAVCGDVVELARDITRPIAMGWTEQGSDILRSAEGEAYRWYVRSSTQLSGGIAVSDGYALITEKLTRAQLDKVLSGESGVLSVIRVLDI